MCFSLWIQKYKVGITIELESVMYMMFSYFAINKLYISNDYDTITYIHPADSECVYTYNIMKLLYFSTLKNIETPLI